jgi:hypothetical protein
MHGVLPEIASELVGLVGVGLAGPGRVDDDGQERADRAADELGGYERGRRGGAIPAQVSVKVRPMVTAGLAKAVASAAARASGSAVGLI